MGMKSCWSKRCSTARSRLRCRRWWRFFPSASCSSRSPVDRRGEIPVYAAGHAVVFALLASYLLSRTLIPNWSISFKERSDLYREGRWRAQETGGWNWKIHRAFNRRFKTCATVTRGVTKTLSRSSGRAICGPTVFYLSSGSALGAEF